MNDKQFEKVVGHLRESYNRPPETPTEDMWQAIQAELAERPDASIISIDAARGSGATRRAKLLRWTGWSVAAAALLVVGIGIGRMVPPVGAPGVATAEADGAGADVASPGTPTEAPANTARSDAAFRFAAVSHLLKSESLLTMVRNDADAGRYDAAVGGWAGELLTETRLLLDSPASNDPAIGELLEDLELILIQLATLSTDEDGTGRSQEEMDLIARGMDRQEMLLRIQAIVPAGAALVGA